MMKKYKVIKENAINDEQKGGFDTEEEREKYLNIIADKLKDIKEQKMITSNSANKKVKK